MKSQIKSILIFSWIFTSLRTTSNDLKTSTNHLGNTRRHQFQFSSVQSLSRVWLFVTPWITARQASLSNTNSRSSLRLISIESVMPSSHLILCCPLLLLPPIPPRIRVFSNEPTLHMGWPKYWRFMGSQRVRHDWATELNWTETGDVWYFPNGLLKFSGHWK